MSLAEACLRQGIYIMFPIWLINHHRDFELRKQRKATKWRKSRWHCPILFTSAMLSAWLCHISPQSSQCRLALGLIKHNNRCPYFILFIDSRHIFRGNINAAMRTIFQVNLPAKLSAPVCIMNTDSPLYRHPVIYR